jgi:hypothetical protein
VYLSAHRGHVGLAENQLDGVQPAPEGFVDLRQDKDVPARIRDRSFWKAG